MSVQTAAEQHDTVSHHLSPLCAKHEKKADAVQRYMAPTIAPRPVLSPAPACNTCLHCPHLSSFTALRPTPPYPLSQHRNRQRTAPSHAHDLHAISHGLEPACLAASSTEAHSKPALRRWRRTSSARWQQHHESELASRGGTGLTRCTPSAITHSWSSMESELERDMGALLTGEAVPRCMAGVKGLKKPGGAASVGGDARLAPASARAWSERASGALLEPPACSPWGSCLRFFPLVREERA
mmetsp:Transcript_4530/g.8802  ORF Transcript_4530/g.8802 Transcript_4530/m.8802 type:complete len:241 (+) Transcript_4530:81-803(+)